MKQLLLSAQGRINRAAFWKGVLILAVIAVAVSVIEMAVAGLAPHYTGDDGKDHLAAGPTIVLALFGFATGCFQIVAGLCLAIKRFHDRNKSGWWVFISVVPIIGAVWYFVETGCLAGTAGTNRFGPDPLSGVPRSAAVLAA